MGERHVQSRGFKSEINAIKSNTRKNLKNQIGLAIDENGIIHYHGRLLRENLSESTFFSKDLSKNHAFTSLVVNSLPDLMHTGVSHTLSTIRREFWIPQGKATVRKVLLNCRRCRKHRGGPYRMPQMASYQPSRGEESSLFA